MPALLRAATLLAEVLKPSRSIRVAPAGTTTALSEDAPICQSQDTLPLGGSLTPETGSGAGATTGGGSGVRLRRASVSSVPATVEVEPTEV